MPQAAFSLRQEWWFDLPVEPQKWVHSEHLSDRLYSKDKAGDKKKIRFLLCIQIMLTLPGSPRHSNVTQDTELCFPLCPGMGTSTGHSTLSKAPGPICREPLRPTCLTLKWCHPSKVQATRPWGLDRSLLTCPETHLPQATSLAQDGFILGQGTESSLPYRNPTPPTRKDRALQLK